MKPRKLTCFVAMPFGVKRIQNATNPDGFETIDFDAVFNDVFRPAIENKLGLDARRVDTDGPRGGVIDDKMWTMLAESDLCLIDISGNNPNVFYELGVRHALHRTGSLIVRLKSNMPFPFDIARIDISDYDIGSQAAKTTAIEDIARGLLGKCNSFTDDSPVRMAVKGLSVKTGRHMSTSKPFTSALKGKPNRLVGVMPGDIVDVRDDRAVDAWVNSENTHMEMARHYDRSISATIRFLGAKRSTNGDIRRDQIEINLRNAARNKRGKTLTRVNGGQVFDTAPGALAETHAVKRLFHVATVRGVAGRGYEPVDDLQGCVSNVLRAAAIYNSQKSTRNRLRSILLPLFGTGSGNRPPEDVVDLLLGAALRFLKSAQTHGLETVWFLAYSTHDEGLLLRSLARRGDALES